MKKAELILIVDDDDDDRELFIEAVNHVDASIHCISATDGEDALHQLNESLTILPDIIFLDLNMPRVDGRQFLAEIKKDNDLQHIPVAIYTTSSLKRDEEETKRAGAQYFITKPSDFKQLCSILVGILNGG